MVEQKTAEVVAQQVNLEKIRQRQDLLIEVLQIMQWEKEVPKAMNMALAEIGKFTGVSRMQIWENNSDGITYGCSYEWCNEGIEPAIHYLRTLPLEYGKPWFDILAVDKIICTSDIYTLPAEIHGILEQQRVKSIVVLPLSNYGVHFGFISFTVCEVRIWDEDDVELLRSISQVVATATQRYQYEKELIRAKERAEESDKLKSAFLANMSHEIRTPMNGIVGFLNHIENRDLPQEKLKEYYKIIHSNVQRLLKLINDILDISKLEVKQLKVVKTPCRLNELMHELNVYYNEIILRESTKKLALILDDSASVPDLIIHVDSVRLRQILTNLIDNAIKFTKFGFIEFGYRLNGEHIIFHVKDTGIGMDEKRVKVIFERFRQADETIATTYGGTGLGLAISRDLANLMGGEMWAESEHGHGSTFFFSILYE
jgi:signal transduction histidine kinase